MFLDGILLQLLMMPQLTNADFLDVLNKITGLGTGPQSLGVSVQTNAVPVIGNVTVYNSPFNAIEAGNNSVFISFIVTDTDGDNNIVNNSAVANISRTGETTRYNDTFVDSTVGGCRAQERGVNFKNFTCNISFVYYDGAGTWNISVMINDSASAFTQNITQTFTINELTALIIYPNSISFPTVGLTDVNVSARANLTINNTGNDDISGREASGEYINVTAYLLGGATNGATFIPTNNFSIGTDIINDPIPSYCDFSRNQNTTRLINNTAALAAVNNFSAGINGSFVLAQATGATEVLSICFLDVPDSLTAQNYTTGSTSWTVSIW